MTTKTSTHGALPQDATLHNTGSFQGVRLPGKSHGRRSLLGSSPWGGEESGTTERLHFHFSLSRIGERNGNPLQHSCLENPRDGRAWWAAVYGVAQSQTRLKQLSSSSSNVESTIRPFCYLLRHLLKVMVNIIHYIDLIIVVLFETTELTHIGCDRLHFDEALDP